MVPLFGGDSWCHSLVVTHGAILIIVHRGGS